MMYDGACEIMKKKYSILFVYLVMLYVTSILIANIAAFKTIEIFSITLTAGTLIFPISYILGDIFSEVYGYQTTKRIIMGGFLCNALMVLMFNIAIKLPYHDYFVNQESFALVLGNTPRVFLAGITAYLIGSLSNSFIMHYIKNNSKIHYLWFRTIISTIVGETLDSIIFLSIAFAGNIENINLILMITYQAIIKIIFEVVMTPFTYKITEYLKKHGKNILEVYSLVMNDFFMEKEYDIHTNVNYVYLITDSQWVHFVWEKDYNLYRSN